MSVLASVTPSDWTEQKFGALFERAQQVGFPELQPLSVFLGDGVVPRSARDDNHNQLGADLSKYQRVQPADIVFNKLRTWQGGIGVSNYEGIVSPAYIVCRPRGAAVEPRFAHHLLRSAPYLAELTRLSKWMPPSQFDISWDEIRTLSLGLPPINDQQRIADFLDDQVSRIDNIIAARRSQQGAIDDEDLASMADALSGGCPEQGGSETGWDWLPRVPATWGVAPVFAFYDAQLGKMLNPERAAGAHPRPYLRNANVHWFDIGVTDLAIMSFEPGERARYRVLPGDLLVCEGGAGVAEAAVWGGEIEECYFQKSLHRVRSRGHLPAEWLMYWLRLAKASGFSRAMAIWRRSRTLRANNSGSTGSRCRHQARCRWLRCRAVSMRMPDSGPYFGPAWRVWRS